MLDVNRIQSNPEELKEMLKKRCMDDTALVDRLNGIIQNKKKLQGEVETLRAERNRVSKEIGIIKSKGGDIQEVSASMKEVGNKIKELEDALEIEENNLADLNLSLPNFLDSEVPFGKSDEDNVETHTYGVKPEFAFTPKTHFEIGEALGIFDFEKGVKLAGGRAYTYFGKAAKLERALMNFMLDTHSADHGYEEVWVPTLVNDESMKTTGQYPKFKDEY